MLGWPLFQTTTNVAAIRIINEIFYNLGPKFLNSRTYLPLTAHLHPDAKFSGVDMKCSSNLPMKLCLTETFLYCFRFLN